MNHVPLEAVLIVSLIGLVFSAWNVWDAQQDLAVAQGDLALSHVAEQRLVSELIRLVAQAVILAVTTILMVDGHRPTARLLLFSLPLLLLAATVWSWWTNRRLRRRSPRWLERRKK